MIPDTRHSDDDNHEDAVAWRHLMRIEGRHRGKEVALKVKRLAPRIQYSVHRKLWHLQALHPHPLHPSVVFTAIELLLRYCAADHVSKFKVAHATEACLWVALKLVRGQDLDVQLTRGSGFIEFFGLKNTCAQTLVQCEAAILKALAYDVTTVTAYDLLVLLLRNLKRHGVVEPEVASSLLNEAVGALKKNEGRPALLEFKPSEVCAAALNQRALCAHLGVEWERVQAVVACML
jgi:hypothetical protein